MKQVTIKHRNISIIFLMLFFFSSVHAQQFVNATLDGAQSVCAITQDKQGMMWLGTDNGLYSYDGYYSYRHYQDHSFSNTRVNALAFKGNMLYLATGNGVLKFDTQKYGYASSPARSNFENASKRKQIKEQRVLDLTQGKGLFGSEVYALLQTSKGLLQGSLSGLRLNKRLIPLKSGEQPLVNALAYDAKRRCYWIGTEGALYSADLNLQKFSKLEELNGNSVKCLAEDAEGTLYIGTDNGLYSLSIHGVLQHYVHDSRDAASIPNNIVWACFVDKWQNVWIGTDNGLSRLSTHTYYTYTPLDKVTFTGEGNCLHAILQTRDGDWWLGGTNGLIRQGYCWYKQNNKYFPLAHNRVRKIYEDREGDVWICTDHGINLFNRSSQQMMNFIVFDKTGKYSTTWAYDILEDRKGRMWMASYNGGIFVIDKARLKASIKGTSVTSTCVADFHFSDKGEVALSGLHVGQIVMDGNGMIWASTYNSLDYINPNTFKVAHVAKADVVNYMMTDDKGNVWVGDNSVVKCYYANVPMRGAQLDAQEWKIGGKVSTMCEVDGSIWAITGNQCCVLGTRGVSYRFMVPGITPLNVFYSKLSHEVIMGGNDGYVSVRSEVVKRLRQPARLLLSGCVVNGKQMQETMLDGEDDDALAPLNAKELVLKSDENNFTLHLTDLPFADHPSAVYAYKLEGSDNDWHYLQKGNLDVVYNGLSYGNYHLTVHLVDGEGNIGQEVYSLDISVLPPWYLSIWAKILYFTALICFIAWLVSYYFIRKQLSEEQKQKAEILEQVDARMDFYHRLAEGLKAAVRHKSFDEVSELVNRTLEVNTTSADIPVATTISKESDESVEVKEQVLDETGDTLGEMGDADRRLIEEITKVIEQNMIDSDFNVTKLQEVVGIGGKQLYRKIKTLTGRTPVEYIRELRLRKAAKLLSAGKFSVSEVMYTVGFSNSSYFSKCFSKAFGMTPTEYMKQ